jgi:hypothetical protein
VYKYKRICDRREIQPFYKKALISLNIFLSKCVSIKKMCNKHKIQPFYKKALISLNIFLIKYNNSYSLIALKFVNKCESD